MNITRSLKINNRTIRYVFEGSLNPSEQQNVDKFIAMAYNMSNHILNNIQSDDEETNKAFALIYGEEDNYLKNIGQKEKKKQKRLF